MKSLSNAGLLASMVLLTACQSSPPADPSLSRLTRYHLNYMQQQAGVLAGELRQFSLDSQAYCQGEQPLPRVQQQWRRSFAGWTAQQGQVGGPLDEQDLIFAFQFWPDKKDVTGRQLRQQLNRAEQGQPVIPSGTSATLGAAEYLLYSELSREQRCLLLPAVGEQLRQQGDTLAAAWANEADYPHRLNAMLGQGQAGALALETRIIAQLAHRYDRLEKKLALALNTVEHPRPYFAESWRSGQSLHFIRTGLQSLEQEYRQGGVRHHLQQKGLNRQAERLDDAFAKALARLPAGDSLANWLEGDSYAALLRFKLSLDQLGYQLKQRLPEQLGLSLGFNATDGD
ncbi:imelysin family protein [Zobellella aerophila]|uniref:Imelysin family protein n=1 Tax=Zobellella aerophila TaxID=870480 RepID=A0ABP6W2M4_9GAMM